MVRGECKQASVITLMARFDLIYSLSLFLHLFPGTFFSQLITYVYGVSLISNHTLFFPKNYMYNFFFF